MSDCPDVIKRLIERFDHQLDQVRSPDYNEAQLRIDFVNPMFSQLGWDIDNAQGFAEQYREVVYEDRIKVGGSTKAPDYSFRVGSQRKFFLEAKKPFVNIKDAWEPAYQLRRYAWTGELAVSLLTDFEELAIYDCRVPPKVFDKASVARRDFFTYHDYCDRWDFIEGTFSKQAVLRGDFDRYCATTRGRGAQPFDDVLLEEIEDWRKKLASNLALRNDDLDEASLNFAVQRIIDRIIFLRICEDRGTERTGRLQAMLGGEEVYARLMELFRDADARYNSGLFHFKREKERTEAPDELTPGLEVDDQTLKFIIKRLYYPDSPYAFDIVSADILGSVYERFLGKVITLTAGHRAKIEDKPEVRKAGGVYYTPTYIVDYIVQETVGELLEGKTPKEAAKLKILDPACGSGSFLIGAYQYLLDWHLKWYVADGAEKWSTGKSATLRPADRPSVAAEALLPSVAGKALGARASERKEATAPSAHWALTTRERKRILLDNIHGVDIDYQAVEVTKLSLLLKVLEGETAETLGRQATLFRERALPDLGRNIQCGNSLIGFDIAASERWRAMSEEERARINPLNYDRAFPEALRQGGFDSVIGNPPWGQKEIAKDSFIQKWIRDRFGSTQGIFDLYRPFVELAVRLTRPGGLLGQVLPDIVLLKDYESTRRLLLDQTTLLHIDWWGMAFEKAVIDAATIIAAHAPAPAPHRVTICVRETPTVQPAVVTQQSFRDNARCTFNLFMTDQRRALIERLERFPRLADFFEAHEGVHSGNIRNELFVDRKVDATCRELLFGRNEISRFSLRWHGRYIRLGALPAKKTRNRYANIGDSGWHERDKLLVRRTGDFVLAAVDEVGRYCSNNFFLVIPHAVHPLDLHGLCALLNSRLMTTFFRMIEPRKGRVFAELKIKHMSVFPVPQLEQVKETAQLNDFGRRRTKIAARLAEGIIAPQRDQLEREAEQLDRWIDERVNDIFGIASEEITALAV